jgi:hypothetical protein
LPILQRQAVQSAIAFVTEVDSQRFLLVAARAAEELSESRDIRGLNSGNQLSFTIHGGFA